MILRTMRPCQHTVLALTSMTPCYYLHSILFCHVLVLQCGFVHYTFALFADRLGVGRGGSIQRWG
jgi:hypothetical protein